MGNCFSNWFHTAAAALSRTGHIFLEMLRGGLMLSKKMDEPTAISSCSRSHARVPDERGTEQGSSDLQALKGLHDLLHQGKADANLQEDSRNLLMRMLDDANEEALLRQGKMIHANDERGAEQVSSDLQALEGIRGLLHRGKADENLDEDSRALLKTMLDDATQKALLRDLKMLAGPLMSPALERRLSVRPERRLTRGDTNRSSRRQANPEQSLARLASRRSDRSAKPVNGSAPRADQSDRRNRPRRRHSSSRSDQSSSSSEDYSDGRNRRRRHRHSSSEPRTRGRARLHDGADGSSTSRLRRLDSGLSMGMTSRRGTQRAARGEARPRRSSSSDRSATTRRRTRPNRELEERRLSRVEEERRTRRRRKDGADASVGMGRSSRPRRRTNPINSGSSSSSGASTSFPSRSPTPAASTSPSAEEEVQPEYASEVPIARDVQPRYKYEVSSARDVQPGYKYEASSASKERRRRERKERRKGKVSWLKKKLAPLVPHRIRSKEDKSKRERGVKKHKLGAIFRRGKGHHEDKKTTSRTAVAKRRSGGGAMRSKFWGMVKHKFGSPFKKNKKKGTGSLVRHSLLKALKQTWGKFKAKLKGNFKRRKGSRMHHAPGLKVKKKGWLKWQAGAFLARISQPRRLGHR